MQIYVPILRYLYRPELTQCIRGAAAAEIVILLWSILTRGKIRNTCDGFCIEHLHVTSQQRRLTEHEVPMCTAQKMFFIICFLEVNKPDVLNLCRV